MTKGSSPLRYPGGKTSLLPLVSEIIRLNGLDGWRYAEPFAGGGGLALSLLYGGFVQDIHLNDVDAGIWAFWHSMLNYTDDFIYRVEKTPLTVDEWRRQRAVVLEEDADRPVDLGFANFFLNRTNRSGIIKSGGLIGGLEQKGNYKLDCRFNREDLAARIKRVARYRDRIHLTRRDALDFIHDAQSEFPKSVFFGIDPPYFKKGPSLYTSFYNPGDHAMLAKSILSLAAPWIVTYDHTPEIVELYKDRERYPFNIQYSLENKRLGNEILITSDGLKVPPVIRERLMSELKASAPVSPPLMCDAVFQETD